MLKQYIPSAILLSQIASSEKDAKAKAAAIYNSQHPNNPVTGHNHDKKPNPCMANKK